MNQAYLDTLDYPNNGISNKKFITHVFFGKILTLKILSKTPG